MSEGEERITTREGGGGRVLGLVTDPDMPTRVGTRLASRLTEWLGERTGAQWTVEVVSDPVTAGEADSREILEAVAGHVSTREWDYAICLTDLPLLLDERPLLADLATRRKAALVSLPALGGLMPYRRTQKFLTRLLDDLLADSGPERAEATKHRGALLGPVHRNTSPDDDVDLRYTAARTRGWLSLISGMVRTNRPYMLIFGLSSALAAALATSAFGLSSSTVWQIGDQLDPARQTVAAIGAIALLVGWLVAAHDLWERPRNRARGHRRLATLYNTSTVLTLTIGVGCMYAGLFVVNLAVAWFIVTPELLASSLGHPVDATTYFGLAWGFTTMGVVAGALGSSLESDRAVRQAAYGYREEQRRANRSEQE